MKTKEQLRLQMENSKSAALKLIAPLDPELLIHEERGWRVKDIMANIVTWETEMLRSLHAYRRGGAYKIEDYEFDDYNGFAASAKQFDPLDQTLAEWETVRSWIGIHFNALPPEALDEKMMMPWGESETVRDLFESIHEHTEEHLASIRAKLSSQAADTLP